MKDIEVEQKSELLPKTSYKINATVPDEAILKVDEERWPWGETTITVTVRQKSGPNFTK